VKKGDSLKEILSPAGNMDYIKVAINNKVGAVYGGFKFLNARNRAVNFTIEEYNKAILLVHENGIKFYLTLNVLLVDEELESLVDLLLSGTVLLPDAFIVADIGLITRLNKTFPNVAIHLSTQFGCHNIYDVKYANSLHADRVILSRELTREEIERITDQSPIEIECFCWGSQCISFSGMCFWGALLNGGGGNNGKCLIPCRDIYEIGNRSGNMLYLSDLNCVNEIKKIEKVVSYKIEGRRRPSNEVEAAIMNVIEGTKDQENGFIFGTDNKQNGLLQTMNARLKPVCKAKNMIPDRYDKFAIFKEGKPVRYCDYEENEDCFYIYSGLFKKYDLNKDNVSFSFIVE
jgi:putative protease